MLCANVIYDIGFARLIETAVYLRKMAISTEEGKIMVQFGSGSNHFPGWDNTDLPEVDVRKRLPYEDGCVDFAMASHLSEHLSSGECFLFFQEVRRILKPSGVFRVVVPDIVRTLRLADAEYMNFLAANGLGNNVVKNLVVNHGHLIFFSADTLKTMLIGAGFVHTEQCDYGASKHPELCDKEWHGKVIGEHNDRIESLIMEATK